MQQTSPISALRQDVAEILSQVDLLPSKLPVRLSPICDLLGVSVSPNPNESSSCVRIIRGQPDVRIRCKDLRDIRNNAELRFELAHELGHVLLHFREFKRPTSRAEYYVTEEACDGFARWLLCPDVVVDLNDVTSASTAATATIGLARATCIPLRAASDRVAEILPEFASLTFRASVHLGEPVLKATTSSLPKRACRGKILRHDDSLFRVLRQVSCSQRPVVLSECETDEFKSALNVRRARGMAVSRVGSAVWFLSFQLPDCEKHPPDRV